MRPYVLLLILPSNKEGTVYSSAYFLPQNDLFANNTRSGSFLGVTLQNNKPKQPFDPAF